MKIWITRPGVDEVWIRGYQNVMVWLEKPMFDHRVMTPDFEFYNSETGEYLEEVGYEHGWFADRCKTTYAKPFLKQCPELYKKVWRAVVDSCMLKGTTDVNLYYENWRDLLYDRMYEAKCKVSKKRFLLEVDLDTKEVELVAPKVLFSDDGAVLINEDPMLLVCTQFLNEDLSRPFDPSFANPYKDRPEISKSRDRLF